jgi:2-polyprenyl-6-methoxyphenol hydroxylase-like FAD-dependent oxidoreductase
VQSHNGVNVAEKTVTLATPHGHVAASYNLLVGADGTGSTVRRAMLACDKTMSSAVSFVAPMRYVTAAHLDAQPTWPQGTLARMTQPPIEALFTDAPVATTGMSCLAAWG